MIRLAAVVVVSSLLVSMAEGQVVPAWSDVHHDNVNQYDRTFVDGLESHPQGGVVAVCTVSTRIVDYPPDIYHYQAVRSQLVGELRRVDRYGRREPLAVEIEQHLTAGIDAER